MKELVSIQGRLKAPKGQKNTFGGYKYRSCEDILEAVKPLLREYACELVIGDEIVMVGDRYYIKATAVLRNSAGEFVNTTAWAREEDTKKGMDASQITGAASSYARKYALCGLFAIDDGKDADSLNTSPAYTSHESDEMLLARQEIMAAREVRTLSGIYNNYKSLQADKTFLQLLGMRKKELENK